MTRFKGKMAIIGHAHLGLAAALTQAIKHDKIDIIVVGDEPSERPSAKDLPILSQSLATPVYFDSPIFDSKRLNKVKKRRK